MAEPDIRVLVGVEGDASIDGSSARLISKTLQSIAKNISGRETPHITFGVDFQKTSKKIYKQLSEITESIKLKPIDLNIRTNQSSIGNSTKGVKKENWDGVFKQSVKDLTAKNIDLNPLNNYYKNLEKQSDAFLKKNLNGIDLEIKAREAQAKAFSAQIKEQMQQKEKEVQSFISQISQLNNAQKILNTSENYANKLGNVNLIGEISHARDNLKTFFVQIDDFTKKNDKLDGIKIDTNDEEFKSLFANLKEYNNAILKMQKLSTQENSLFIKDERIAKQSKDISDFTLSLDRFEKSNDKFKTNSGASAEFEKIKTALTDIERRNKLGETVGIDLENLKKQTNDWKSSLEIAGLSGQTTFGKLRAQMEKLGVYLSTSAILMGTVRQIKQMTSNVIELDSAMTELKKVTTETDGTYSKFLDGAEVRAKSIGATLTDTIKSTADAARMGYSLSESESLADTFNIYKNVGDGVKDIEQASSTVISTMKAFGIEAKNSIQIVDAYNEVSNNFAVRSDEIGLAVADMGAAFAGAGNSMEESIAVYTGMNEIIQDWSKSSTAMRTIAARLRNTAGELEELGVDSEGAAESITKLQTQLLNITKGKVDIMASPDEFKNTTQILRELATVWDDLSDKDRADVTRLVSGTRQQSTLQAVLTNWEQVEAAIGTAIDSEGSAYVENQKYLDSIKGRAAQFQAQYEALSNTIINSDLIKFTYDSGTGLLGFLDGVIKNLDSIPTLAIVATGAISAFSNKGGLAKISVAIQFNCIEFHRTYALCNLVETLNELVTAGKRLHSKSLKWCA